MTKTRYPSGLAPSLSPANMSLQTACRVAIRYAHRMPTVSELQRDFGMHRSTAYRWLSALRAARGEHQEFIESTKQGFENA